MTPKLVRKERLSTPYANQNVISQERTNIIQLALTVTQKHYITPHYIRVYLTGEGVSRVGNTTVGFNNKILIPPSGLNTVHFPELDPQTRQWKTMVDELRPTVRTYTHRGVNLIENELWIDFVAHGDEGPASAWAIRAKPGDVLGVLMKDGKRDLYPMVDHYVLVGDATALPVLSAILEELPASASGHCLIEVPSKADEQILPTQANIRVSWLHNESPKSGSQLTERLKELFLPDVSRFAYVAAESATVKAIRSYLRQERGWQQDELVACSYWKAGVSEDESHTERLREEGIVRD